MLELWEADISNARMRMWSLTDPHLVALAFWLVIWKKAIQKLSKNLRKTRDRFRGGRGGHGPPHFSCIFKKNWPTIFRGEFFIPFGGGGGVACALLQFLRPLYLIFVDPPLKTVSNAASGNRFTMHKRLQSFDPSFLLSTGLFERQFTKIQDYKQKEDLISLEWQFFRSVKVST